MAPYSEDAVRAMWADESMGPSSFDDIIDTYEEQATYDFDRTCALIHIPRIPESDEVPSFSHPETAVSRSNWEEIEDGDFVRLVTRDDVLCPRSSLFLRFWNRQRHYPFMNEDGTIRLNEMSSDVFFLSRTFDGGHAKFQRNFRVPRALIVGWSFLGFPAEVHFYGGEVECEECNTSHPRFFFRQHPHSESDEAIQMALDIARRNHIPPNHPTIIPLPSFLTNRDAECILCHSSCTSTLCLGCGRKQKDGSTLILLDSGASRHCTPHFEDFIPYKPYGESKFSTTADKDTFVEKLGLGTVLMLHHGKIIRLTDVEYCLSVACRLISTGQLIGRGYSLSTTASGTKLFAPNDDLYLWSDLIASVGPLHYVCVLLQFIDEKVQVISSKKDEYLLWHHRMGHPSKNAIEHLHSATRNFKAVAIPTDLAPCSGCATGKMAEKPFTLSYSCATKPLELIHSDLCEFPTLSYYRCQYVATFVDDFSAFACIYPLAVKSDTFRIFQEYKAWAENSLGAKLLRLRSDRGGEFRTNEFSAFMRQSGIEQQFSSPDTPQQNGRAE